MKWFAFAKFNQISEKSQTENGAKRKQLARGFKRSHSQVHLLVRISIVAGTFVPFEMSIAITIDSLVGGHAKRADLKKSEGGREV